MPTVLITGLNGFVAVHTAVIFLSNGWSVRGTVRSKEKAEKVKSLPVLKEYVDQGKVELVILEDLIEGDFSEALKGVDGVAHCASPWHFNGKKWEDYREPAVKGTTRIIEQAADVPSVKSIAVVSSFASIGDFSKPATEQAGRVYTEEDWCPNTDEFAANFKGDAAPQIWYVTSKKLAEEAAFATEKKIGNKHSLGTVCPPCDLTLAQHPMVILGPAIHCAEGDDLSKADVSTSMLYSFFAAGKDAKLEPTDFPLWGDVRNVAQALFEIVTKHANGRFAICNGAFAPQALANRARELYPDLAKAGIIPVGEPDNTPSKDGAFKLDGSKAERELGIKYTTVDEMIKDTIEQMKKIGAIKA
ncbi:hypothetical protein BD324DRAFT_575517 [Kockovaella imperatae]|uniref:NAD-dependent epimerase/dehydratase domain-containing protein n=1 Tax=Kockovaella imperatae TaxID=4999 RepID=A0A1Y1UNK2_9TREE|nr:hypothetical protein BD324DRAFT_575517 [Kockovaella imperatae]ORX39572.1 hypothetical protein BD324DRAFT_575517 [Kockovaella imperatae]